MTSTTAVRHHRSWGFLTPHAVALRELAQTPDLTVQKLSERLGLTQRQTHRVLGDLVMDGYVRRTRVGRRNRYELDTTQPLRHPTVAHRPVAELLTALSP